MSARDFYKVSFSNSDVLNSLSVPNVLDSGDYVDNADTEFNANQFTLYDDFSADLRINFTSISDYSDTLSNAINNSIVIEANKQKSCEPNDSGVDMENGNPLDDNTPTTHVSDLSENEIIIDTWSSMDSSNSPLTDSGPSASEDCTPSTSREPPREPLGLSSPLSPNSHRLLTELNIKSHTSSPILPKTKDTARPRDLNLAIEILEPDPLSRRPHFLDDDYQPKSKVNIECIPKPHFLDHSPSPDEFDERSDITNPNFLEDEVDGDDTTKKVGVPPIKSSKSLPATCSSQEDKPHRTNYRTALHYGLENAARSNKRASQLYSGTWPGDNEVWTGHSHLDVFSVRSFSSNGSTEGAKATKLDNKMECVSSLISLLSLSPENNADLSGPLFEMSRSAESCIVMRQAGCIPLLVQLIHTKVPRETRDRAAKALRNIIHTQTDDKAGRREARVWRLLEQVREYCYVLEDIVEAKKEGKEVTEDDNVNHPSQSVAALMKLSFDEEHRHVVCQLGGLQALATLVSNDQAAHGSRTDDSTCLTMRKYAGMTLTNLTFGDGNNKSLLCSFKDFMLALVEQLESSNDDMRQVTAAVLRNLSWRADTNSKQVLREVGAVRGLTKAAMTCQKEATLKSVLSALWNLTAHCSMNKVALCSVEGALGFLVDMLSYDSPTKTLAIVENAGGIMRNVSSHIAVREDYRQILRERNCLSVLLQHLKSPSLTVVSNSCGTLWNLSARCPQDQHFLWDHGAVPMLRSLIHSKHKMIAMGSSAALKNLLNSKPGKTHIVSLDTTARNMNLPALPTLVARKQKTLEQELDQNLAETCDNIEPVTSPTTSNREERNLFTATERQIAMNLERHRMTSSSPLMSTLASQISLSHSTHLASYLSCSNTLLKDSLVPKAVTGSAGNVNRSDSKDSVTSTHSDSVFEKVLRMGKVPIPTPRSKDLTKDSNQGSKIHPETQENTFIRYSTQPPIPPPRTTADLRTNYIESGFDVDQDSCDQPIDYSRKYSETKTTDLELSGESKPDEDKKYLKKDESSTFGDYQETDLDQPTDYSLRYAEHPSGNCSDAEPSRPSVNEDTIKHFATEGTPYETPMIFSTATSMSDLRVIGKDLKVKTSNIKENPEIMTNSDEKDTCSIEDPPRHNNDRVVSTSQNPTSSGAVIVKRGVFDTKFSSGMISPEKPVNYCDEGTPGYFSRVSSLSSLGEPTEEDNLAKKNAIATIYSEPSQEQDIGSISKDKDNSKAVTFARSPTEALDADYSLVEDTPLMFSRASSPSSLPSAHSHGSVLSSVSRLTSGCISPSDIPDSPGACMPLFPRHCSDSTTHDELSDSQPAGNDDHTEDNIEEEMGGRGSVFEERVSHYMVEHTPAQFSRTTSLSSLTINTQPDTLLMTPCNEDELENAASASGMGLAHEGGHHSDLYGMSAPSYIRDNDTYKGVHSSGDTCKVYFTEDTPALLSKAGSNSNLSALSIPSSKATPRDVPEHLRDLERDAHDTSDSSNLSDAGDLLEECIQKGIAKVVKNKGPSSEAIAVNSYKPYDNVYRSVPPYLRSSTETVRTSQDLYRTTRYSSSRSGISERHSPPPLPPRRGHAPSYPTPPPPPPRQTGQSRMTGCSSQEHGALSRKDSSSSLSLDSFGSTDREIFEETVKAGLSRCNPKADYEFEDKIKVHSTERNSDTSHRFRQHKSLDKSEKIIPRRSKVKDVEFEKNIAAGAYNITLEREITSKFTQSFQDESCFYRQPKQGTRMFRLCDDGPTSLPAKIDDAKCLDRSNSLSSLSNDSFGSTDKEVFERCVRKGMSKAVKKSDKLRVRSDDRLEIRESHKRRTKTEQVRPQQGGALDKMIGEEYSKDRAILEEVIAKGAGEIKENSQPKNVLEPSATSAIADGVPAAPNNTGFESTNAGITRFHENNIQISVHNTINSVIDDSNELYTVDSLNSTLETTRINEIDRSNECLAPKSVNTTIDSEEKDELNRSNESYADFLDGSLSDVDYPSNEYAGTLNRKDKLEWTDIKINKPGEDVSKRSTDTWNDNTCLDDITFPTFSGSVHMVSSIKSDVTEGVALPDLLEKSEMTNILLSRPDLTNKLDDELIFSQLTSNNELRNTDSIILGDNKQPSFSSFIKHGEPKLDSMVSSAIEQEATRLAAQLKYSQYVMENSVSSLTSVDLDNIKPPSNLGSLLSLSASGQWDESSTLLPKKTEKCRKKSLPVALMVKRALSISQHQGSSEHLDSNPVSFLDNVKPPSEMENLDMESSIISVSSIVSEVADTTEKTTVAFDFKQPIQDFPHCKSFTAFLDLDKVNPPSLFDEMAESTMELDTTTAHQEYDECCASNTLNVVTDIPSGSEMCTPIPSDVSSVESTPKRKPNGLTPKEKRIVSKDRYQTYTITDTVTENDVTLEYDTQEFVTWTKTESDRSDNYFMASSEPRMKKKITAKQRRLEDRARYQTQTVDVISINNIVNGTHETNTGESNIQTLKEEPVAKKTMKQKRIEDAERFRTRTLSDDIPPSPTFVTKDVNFENIETTTGYDSLSSNEPTHQQIIHDRNKDNDVFSNDVDSGHNEDDFELSCSRPLTYTDSFRQYLPIVENSNPVDICVMNNLKNLEMTVSYHRALQIQNVNRSSSDFASYEGESNSEDRINSDSDPSPPTSKPKPKIMKPIIRREDSLDSNDSRDKEQETSKGIRGRKKAAYISPYRQNITNCKKPSELSSIKTPAVKSPKPNANTKSPMNNVKAHTNDRIPNKTPIHSKSVSANTSPKKTLNKLTTKKVQHRPVSMPVTGNKHLPLERQGTFTKEESTVPTKDLPVLDKNTVIPRHRKSTSPVQEIANTSPSRLPQWNRTTRAPLRKTISNETKSTKSNSKLSEITMKNSASNYSLQSNDSGKTVALASKDSKQGSTSSISSVIFKTKDVESRIAGLWKKVEQTKKQTKKPDKRVWIESDKTEPPKLIRSSTFEGQPKQKPVSSAPKQKSALTIKDSHIPAPRPNSTPTGIVSQTLNKKTVNPKTLLRKSAV